MNIENDTDQDVVYEAVDGDGGGGGSKGDVVQYLGNNHTLICTALGCAGRLSPRSYTEVPLPGNLTKLYVTFYNDPVTAGNKDEIADYPYLGPGYCDYALTPDGGSFKVEKR